MTTPDPWDDDRLGAAFAARAAMAAPVPADLPTDTMVALRRRPARSDAPWWRPLPIAAATPEDSETFSNVPSPTPRNRDELVAWY